MFEQLKNTFENLIGGQDARAASAGATPARMENPAPAGAPVAQSSGNMGGTLGAAIAKVNAATAAGLPPGVSGTGPIDRLPEAARVKYRELEAESNAAFAIIGALNEQLSDARVDLSRIEARIQHLRAPEGGRVAEDSVSIASAREQAARARAEVERVAAEIRRRQEQTKSARSVFAAIETYVRDLRSVPIIAVAPPVTVSSPKSGDWRGAIEAVRQRIEKLREDAQAVEDAPQPKLIALERARAEIERIAARGAPRIMSLIESQSGEIEWPQRFVPPAMFAGPAGPVFSSHEAREFDALAFTLWLHKDAILERIEAEIADHSDDKSALDEPTRGKKRRQIVEAILNAEREECALIEMAREAGVVIAHRADVDARALLQLSDACPAPARDLL